VAIAGNWGSAPMAVESDLSSASSNGKESLQSLCAILYLSRSVSEQADRRGLPSGFSSCQCTGRDGGEGHR
jgi:hypothetical protein